MANGAPPLAGAGDRSAASSGYPPPPPPPKILLAKPPLQPSSGGPASAAGGGGGGEDDAAGVVLRSRNNAPQPGSLTLVSDAWEIHTDKILPFLTENNDFMVIGVIGPSGVGKSTIMNELYGYDSSSPGMLPPFATQSDEIKAMAKHCTAGIELRVSNERLILLDSQPVYSPSVLVDMMRPDGSSAISVLNGEPLSADLAHELMGIQGVDDFTMWQLMLTVDLLKHNIPDPSLLASSPSQSSGSVQDKENKSDYQPSTEDHVADLCFVHTRLREQDLSPTKSKLLRQALSRHFSSSLFGVSSSAATSQIDYSDPPSTKMEDKAEDSSYDRQDIFFIPLKAEGNSTKFEVGTCSCMLGMLRDQILSRTPRSFAKNLSERDWLRSSAKIWDLVKKSPVISDYCKTLQNSGLFRK